jgi:hypothetical protein
MKERKWTVSTAAMILCIGRGVAVQDVSTEHITSGASTSTRNSSSHGDDGVSTSWVRNSISTPEETGANTSTKFARLAAPSLVGTAARAKDKDIAVFCYSFGNYRNEVEGIERGPSHAVRGYSSYDWYFFTDAPPQHRAKLENLGFRVGVFTPFDERNMLTVVEARRTNLSDYLTSQSSRLKTKWFKFGHVPSVLHRYDYIIHLDASIFSKNRSKEGVRLKTMTLKT